MSNNITAPVTSKQIALVLQIYSLCITKGEVLNKAESKTKCFVQRCVKMALTPPL